MKREIRFRAWDGANMLSNHEINGNWLLAGDLGTWDVMQLTGVSDKNNAPIYEGDICRIYYYHDPNEPGIIGVVKWIDTGFSIQGIKNLNNEQITSIYSLRFKSGGNYGDYPAVEVIGNIYQHKHLLP